MEIINKAYSIDIGNSGIAFMNGTRLRKVEELFPYFDDLYVMKLEPTNEIIGLVKAKLIDQTTTVGIELLVVNHKFQVLLFYL